MRASALYIEGIEHVQRHLEGARGEQALAICERMLSGLKTATRPQEFAGGVRAACEAVIPVARSQLKADG